MLIGRLYDDDRLLPIEDSHQRPLADRVGEGRTRRQLDHTSPDIDLHLAEAVGRDCPHHPGVGTLATKAARWVTGSAQPQPQDERTDAAHGAADQNLAAGAHAGKSLKDERHQPEDGEKRREEISARGVEIGPVLVGRDGDVSG